MTDVITKLTGKSVGVKSKPLHQPISIDEELVEEIVVYWSPRKDRIKTKEEHWEYEQDVFIEHIADKICISSISFSSMVEQKCFKIFELTDCVVT